jgi:hypothetical protein
VLRGACKVPLLHAPLQGGGQLLCMGAAVCAGSGQPTA